MTTRVYLKVKDSFYKKISFNYVASGACDQFFFLFEIFEDESVIYRLVLELLLGLASVVPVVSAFCGTHGQILFSQVGEPPNL
jgi:hypothetical protein